MKNITFILVLICSFGASAQTWQTIPSEHFNIYKYSSEIEIEEKGTYLIRLLDHGKVIGNQKVIIN